MKVIAKPLGSGKTTSIKQLVSTSKERCLVVVNDIKSQETFRNIATICNHEENKFSKVISTKDNIVKLATDNKCHIESKSGRGGGFFLVFDWFLNNTI